MTNHGDQPMNLMNQSNAALVDAFGALKAEQAELAKREKALKAAIATRMDAAKTDAMNGGMFRVTRSEAERVTLDSAAVRSLLSADALAAVSKVSVSTTFRVNARVAQAEAA
jgi:hypothetical protein